MRVLEFFAGIGGFAAAFPNLEIVEAIDIDQSASRMYAANFPHPYSIKEIASLPLAWFSERRADLWWMSPPCTPFTQRGEKRDLDDPRSSAIKHLIHVVAAVRPPLVCLENVVGFETSQTFDRLQNEWTQVGYQIRTRMLCPSELGWPNRRPRVYCIASLDVLPEPPQPICNPRPLHSFLEKRITPESHPNLWLKKEMADRFFEAMDRIDLSDDQPITACFAASYGKAVVRSGSYLQTPWGFRRFSPREVARLLGFENSYVLPENLSVTRRWHLLGNSLSLPAVRHVLGDCFAAAPN